jgi:YVTN family beta-propeller protein
MEEKKGSKTSLRPLKAFVCNLMSEMLSLIDLETRTVTNVHVGTNPVFSVVNVHNPDEAIVSLHNYDRKDDEGYVVLVDLEANDVKKRVLHPGPAMPSGIVYDKKRDIIYVADENVDRIYAHDAKTLDVVSYLDAGRAPVHVDISLDNRHLVATNRLSADLCVYDLQLKAPTATNRGVIRLGQAPSCHPYDVKFSKRGKICYVTDFAANTLLVVDIRKHRVTDRVEVGASPFGMTLSADGTTAYVCNLGGNSVSITDLKAKTVISEITGIDGAPSHCVIDESHHQLLVTCQGGTTNGSVQVFDLHTEELVSTIVDSMIQAPIGISLDR